MYFYLTTNEFYSGVYQGQVIDVVDFLRDELKVNIKLVAFLPIKGFFKRRKEIISKAPGAIVVPMTPKQSDGGKWKQNRFLLHAICRIYNCNAIIARGPFASWLAISAKEKLGKIKVCYDGRGALAAEEKEYKIFPAKISKNIYEIEQQAILFSDYRICITESLLNYWKKEYNYNGSDHIIIPGTLNQSFINVEINSGFKNDKKNKLEYVNTDIVLVYAGSTEGWQSFQLLYDFLVNQFNKDESVKVLFLSREEKNITKLTSEFPGRVKRLWLQPSEVRDIMAAGDYGLIIREKSVTNQVAMPTKFPEYLACGLNIISNNSVEEITGFVQKHGCGFIIENDWDAKLKVNSNQDIIKNRALALKYFNKYAPEFKLKYSSLIDTLNT